MNGLSLEWCTVVVERIFIIVSANSAENSVGSFVFSLGASKNSPGIFKTVPKTSWAGVTPISSFTVSGEQAPLPNACYYETLLILLADDGNARWFHLLAGDKQLFWISFPKASIKIYKKCTFKLSTTIRGYSNGNAETSYPSINKCLCNGICFGIYHCDCYWPTGETVDHCKNIDVIISFQSGSAMAIYFCTLTFSSQPSDMWQYFLPKIYLPNQLLWSRNSRMTDSMKFVKYWLAWFLCDERSDTVSWKIKKQSNIAIIRLYCFYWIRLFVRNWFNSWLFGCSGASFNSRKHISYHFVLTDNISNISRIFWYLMNATSSSKVNIICCFIARSF